MLPSGDKTVAREFAHRWGRKNAEDCKHGDFVKFNTQLAKIFNCAVYPNRVWAFFRII